MAHVKSPFPISGSLGDLVFVHTRGKVFLRHKPTFNKEKWATAPQYARSRENATRFGLASRLACAIYRPLQPWKALLQPYSHNQIIAAFTQALPHRGPKHKAIHPQALIRPLRELQLSANPATIQVQPQGPAHHPTQLHLTLGQQPIVPAGHRLEHRLNIIRVRIPTARLHKDTHDWHLTNKGRIGQVRTTEWIPTTILPETIDIPLEEVPADQPHLIYLIAEYRQVHQKTGTTKARHDLGSLQLAAIHQPEHNHKDLATGTTPTAAKTLEANRNHAAAEMAEAAEALEALEAIAPWQEDPRRFLQEALAPLRKATG